MIRVKRTLSLAVFGLAIVLGGHAAVSAAPLFEAREQIAACLLPFDACPPAEEMV